MFFPKIVWVIFEVKIQVRHFWYFSNTMFRFTAKNFVWPASRDSGRRKGKTQNLQFQIRKIQGLLKVALAVLLQWLTYIKKEVGLHFCLIKGVATKEAKAKLHPKGFKTSIPALSFYLILFYCSYENILGEQIPTYIVAPLHV